MYKFAPADRDESIVFGAARPRYSNRSIQQWIEFMQSHDIKQVCCLLQRDRLSRYSVDLLSVYRQEFARENLLWQPIPDFQLPHPQILIERIIPYLKAAENKGYKVVVHCGGGVGRTGIVLASWLVSYRGLSNRKAISALNQNKRYPQEAIVAALFYGKNPWEVKRQLDYLLDNCRHAFEQC